MSIERPICVLMAALGGQGGGVLADWLVTAARIEGLEAQATSIPGVAQRTGATTYYFEVYPQRDLPARPVFSIFPASGAIDLMVSFEPMEAARALSGGYISSNTTVITARERIYATFEKIKPGDGITPLAPVLDALGKIAGTLNIVEMTTAAREAKCHPNAVMFGAMVASNIMPMSSESCRKAIAGSGVAIEANLAGFEAGMNLTYGSVADGNGADPHFEPAPEALEKNILALPEALRAMAGHGAARLLDYQDMAYANTYLERLGRIMAKDSEKEGWALSLKVAQRLAAWMAFEDIIRVAQLKTRPGRMKRIREELGIGDGAPFFVHDFLKPGREELRGMLPKAFDKWIPASRKGRGSPGIPLKINTAGPVGFAMMRFLASRKSSRVKSRRFDHEQSMIKLWLNAIFHAADEDYTLACNIADLAVWARGYGETRNRGFAELGKLLENSQQKLKSDKSAYGTAVLASLNKAQSDPDKEVA